MRKIFLLMLFVSFVSCGGGEDDEGSQVSTVYNGDVDLRTQDEVIEFGSNNYSEINGRLSIYYTGSGDEITSLEPLSNLKKVNFTFRIQNVQLLDLEGLNSLENVGGDFIIQSAIKLLNINALTSFTIISGKLNISNNDSLLDIDGLNQIQSLQSLTINENLNLLSIDGISNIDSIEEDIFISKNFKLTNIDALSNISTIKNIVISFNFILKDLNGLSSLTNVENSFKIDGNYSQTPLNIGLINLMGLDNLTTIGGEFNILDNEDLLSLDGLESLISVGGTIWIDDNTSLVDFCALLPSTINAQVSFNPGWNGYNPTQQDLIDGNCSQ